MADLGLVSIPQYAPVDWPWGTFPRLPRTPWSPSPWRVVLFDGDHAYERRILQALLIYLTIHSVMLVVKDKRGGPLSVRPTIVCGTLHATGTALGSTLLLGLFPGRRELWGKRILPFSVSYFMADILWYCAPKKDLTMTLHHLVMIGCHYPVGEDLGAYVGGAGDKNWCVWLSMVGYLSEWTTAFLNVRWLLAHTLKKHHLSFSVVSFLLLGTYAYRLVLFPYLLIVEILPKYEQYVRMQQIWTFYIIVLGHLVVLQLSIQWVAVILKVGLRNFLVFVPKKEEDTKGQFNWREAAFSASATGSPLAAAPPTKGATIPSSRKNKPGTD